MKRGRRPKLTCPRELHIRFSDEEMEILDSMGPGAATQKIHNLILDYRQRVALAELMDVEDTLKSLQARKDEIQRKLRSY
jgi:hypothetical protein